MYPSKITDYKIIFSQVAKMGQDGHDRGAKVIASGFADLVNVFNEPQIIMNETK